MSLTTPPPRTTRLDTLLPRCDLTSRSNGMTIVADADTGSLGMCRSAPVLPPGFQLDAWLGDDSIRILEEWATVLLAGAAAATIGVGVTDVIYGMERRMGDT